MQVYLELPEECLKAIKLPEEEIQGRLKKELAVRLYSKNLLSFGKARQLAGITRWEFHDLLGKENVVRRYDVRELEEDLKTLHMPGSGGMEGSC